MFKLLQEQHLQPELQSKKSCAAQPIIIVQDINHGNISTTNDVLSQLELHRYSGHLKGVDLDQFMHMTDERDFKQFGIRKQKDCFKLSQCAQSIRRTSFASSVSSQDDESLSPISTSITESYPPLETQNVPALPLTTSAVTGSEQQSIKPSDSEEDVPVWPNSISTKKKVKFSELPPTYSKTKSDRRNSLPHHTPPEYEMDQRRRHSLANGILFRQREILPKYTCTVQKMGKGQAKVEYESPNVRARRRQWRDVYLELQGTMLKVYEVRNNKPTTGGYSYLPTLNSYYQQPVKYVSLYNISLANTKIDLAPDYTKKPNVFRITSMEGPQILVQVQTNAAVSSWIEKLFSGCNIAVDLEHQRMPSFDSSILQSESYSDFDSLERLPYQNRQQSRNVNATI